MAFVNGVALIRASRRAPTIPHHRPVHPSITRDQEPITIGKARRRAFCYNVFGPRHPVIPLNARVERNLELATARIPSKIISTSIPLARPSATSPCFAAHHSIPSPGTFPRAAQVTDGGGRQRRTPESGRAALMVRGRAFREAERECDWVCSVEAGSYSTTNSNGMSLSRHHKLDSITCTSSCVIP